jgi:hypothetical protein
LTYPRNPTGKGGFQEHPENINKAGSPKGRRWADIISEIGELTPVEAAEHFKKIMGKLKTMGDGITLKEAVVARVYADLLFDPSAPLLKEFIERTDGKMPQELTGTISWKEFIEQDADPEEGDE